MLSTNESYKDTVADYNIDIEKASESINNGHFHSEDEAREISKKWGRK